MKAKQTTILMNPSLEGAGSSLKPMAMMLLGS
jgi:hypothetical protein